MSRPRLRLRRTLVLLLLLLLLALLLELNRWLPGTWPGGGGSGWEARALPAAERRDDRPKRDDETADPDVGVARPTEDERPLPLPKLAQVNVLVLSADGTPATDARLGGGAGGAMDAVPDAKGWTQLERRDVLAHGLRVRHGQRDLRHLGAGAAGTPAGTGPWIVHLPDSATPPLRSAQAREVRLETPGSTPAAGTIVEALGANGDVLESMRADAAGKLRVERLDDVVRLRVKDRPDAGSPWVSLRESEPFRWPLGDAAARVIAHVRGLPDDVAVRVRPADSEVASEPVARGPDGALRLPAERWPGGETVELTWTTRDGVQVTWRTELPQGEALEADARLQRMTLALPEGEAPPEAWTVTVSGSTAQGARGDRDGRLTTVTRGRGVVTNVVLPASPKDAVALLDDGVHAPRTLRLGDDAGRTLPAARDGVLVGFKVEQDDEGRAPVWMDVRARSVIDGRAVLERRGRLEAAGGPQLDLGPFAPGDVEIVAWSPGRLTWTETVHLDEATSMTFVDLPWTGTAVPLSLRVHTPSGLPVAGARVVLSVDDGGAPLLLPPPLDEMRTDENGRLEIPAYLPERPLRIQVEAPGLRPADVRRVTPGPGVHFITLVP